jgi:beta-lactamase class A
LPALTTTTNAPSTRRVEANEAFRSLEQRFDARLGVWAHDTGTATLVEYGSRQRFAFCSTVKVFSAAATLRRYSLAGLDRVVRYGSSDVLDYSPITQQHVQSGMTLRAVCDAAVRFSDNTAANLLYREIGGPAALQHYLRTLGDSITNCVRTEPDLNAAVPGDLRDTTTARAWGEDLERVAIGPALAEGERVALVDWMVGNTTGNTLVRAAVPTGWRVGDKTGTGDYGTRNDIAVVWPPHAKPIIIVLMSSRSRQNDAPDDRLIAQAARTTLDTLR